MEILLVSIARKYSFMFSLDFDDCYSEAKLAFLNAQKTYDKTKSNATFKTYAYKCASNAVINFVRAETRYKHIAIEDSPEPSYITPEPITEVLSKLSSNARAIAEYLLIHYEDSYAELGAFKIRGKLRRDLADEGWKQKEVSQGITELKQYFGYGR